MTATRYNVPPSSTLVMTVLVPRTSPSRNPCTARSSRQLFWCTERTPNVLPLPRIRHAGSPGSEKVSTSEAQLPINPPKSNCPARPLFDLLLWRV
jgi:hypothetical protein